MNSRKGLLIVCLAGLAAIGCSDRELRPLNPCTLSSVSNNPQVQNLDKVDLLFMIDDSNSMAPRQALIRKELPNMVRGLLSGDPDNDPSNNPNGEAPFPKVASLRVGVITSDMGVAGFSGRPGPIAGTPFTTDVVPTPTCGFRQGATVTFSGEFASGSMTVTNVTVRTTNVVSRNMLPTLTAAEVDSIVVGTRLDGTIAANAGLPAASTTTITAYDPAARTLTLSAAATGNATLRTFVGSKSSQFLLSKARYGDDGLLYRATNSTDANGTTITVPGTGNPTATPPVPDVNADCDVDGDGFDDTLAYADMPAYLTFDQTGSQTQAAYLNNVVCISNVGNNGCGFEQQLESIMKAISPSTQADFFHDPSEPQHATGHGDDAATNGPWFRQDSLLAIVYLSDEEDCSASNAEVFDPTLASSQEPAAWNMSDPRWYGKPYSEINTRCNRFQQFLHEPKRYADGILAARGGNASRVVFAAITGVPQNLTNDVDAGEGSTNLAQILADDQMSYTYTNVEPATEKTVDANNNAYAPQAWLTPACRNATDRTNVATPGRRVVQVAQLLQSATDSTGAPTPVPVFVSSICNDDYHDAVTQILTLISNQLAAACLPRALNPNSEGKVGCEVREDLNVGEHCADFGGRTQIGTIGSGATLREVCSIEQLAVTGSTVPSGHGWFYDDFSPLAQKCGSARPQRVSFTAGDDSKEGRQLHIECLQTITGSGLAADINTPCGSSNAGACDLALADRQAFCLRYNLHSAGCNDASAPNVLSCETMTNTCQIPCSTDADCPGSFDCFAANGGAKVCVNPTCGTQQ